MGTIGCADCGTPIEDSADIPRIAFIKFRRFLCPTCYKELKEQTALATGRLPTSYGGATLKPGWAPPGAPKVSTSAPDPTLATVDHIFMEDPTTTKCSACGEMEATVAHRNALQGQPSRYRPQRTGLQPGSYWATPLTAAQPKPMAQQKHRFKPILGHPQTCGVCGGTPQDLLHNQQRHKFREFVDIATGNVQCDRCGKLESDVIHKVTPKRTKPEPEVPAFAKAAADFANGLIDWDTYQEALTIAGIGEGFAEPKPVKLSACPGCGATLPEDDLAAQKAHMEAYHQDIIAERLAENRRWDGWEQD